VEYRAGHFAAAAEHVRHVIRARKGGNSPEADTFSVLAMAQHRLGKLKESRDSFAKARRAMEGMMPDFEQGQTFNNKQDWYSAIWSQMLFREAGQVMKEPAPATRQTQ
jgi:hypothetical protein